MICNMLIIDKINNEYCSRKMFFHYLLILAMCILFATLVTCERVRCFRIDYRVIQMQHAVRKFLNVRRSQSAIQVQLQHAVRVFMQLRRSQSANLLQRCVRCFLFKQKYLALIKEGLKREEEARKKANKSGPVTTPRKTSLLGLWFEKLGRNVAKMVEGNHPQTKHNVQFFKPKDDT